MKIVGYCDGDNCKVPVGDTEIGTHCKRCGNLLLNSTICNDPDEPAAKSRRVDRLSGRGLSEDLKRRHKKEKENATK